MLKLYFTDELTELDKKNVIIDVERAFSALQVADTIQNRNVIKKIEQGTYANEAVFLDRFGTQLPISELSTGAKAALCVLGYPDKIINLDECGFNARDYIICNMTDGSVCHPISEVTYYSKNKDIDVQLDNRRFNNLDDLNYYIQDQRDFIIPDNKE